MKDTFHVVMGVLGIYREEAAKWSPQIEEKYVYSKHWKFRHIYVVLAINTK